MSAIMIMTSMIVTMMIGGVGVAVVNCESCDFSHLWNTHVMVVTTNFISGHINKATADFHQGTEGHDRRRHKEAVGQRRNIHRRLIHLRYVGVQGNFGKP